uniref:Uncharacterized protein n=1 Tax=Arundo donax TaxID=35708 RepID=A0A0A8Z5H9_ARUDO
MAQGHTHQNMISSLSSSLLSFLYARRVAVALLGCRQLYNTMCLFTSKKLRDMKGGMPFSPAPCVQCP